MQTNKASQFKPYSLRKKQVHTLILTYKFRFITSSLLADFRSISQKNSNKSLKILLEHGYLDKNFEKSYIIEGKGPRYYLTRKSITYLRETTSIDPRALRVMYKNGALSTTFIEHSLEVMKVYLQLRTLYPGDFETFTKIELYPFASLPPSRPDLYLRGVSTNKGNVQEYMLDIVSNDPFFVIKKRINRFIEHYDSEVWLNEDRSRYPTILLVCPDNTLQDKVRGYVQRLLSATGIDEVTFLTTTNELLNKSSVNDKAIWQRISVMRPLVALSTKQTKHKH